MSAYPVLMHTALDATDCRGWRSSTGDSSACGTAQALVLLDPEGRGHPALRPH
jgi:hypothetical protein